MFILFPSHICTHCNIYFEREHVCVHLNVTVCPYAQGLSKFLLL